MNSKAESLLSDLYETHLVSKLNHEADKAIMRKIKTAVVWVTDNILKPMLIAIGIFYVLTRVRGIVGEQNIQFVQLTIVIIYLRLISSKMKN